MNNNNDNKIYIIVNAPTGGTRLTSKNWAETLRAAGHDVALVTFLNDPFPDDIHNDIEKHMPYIDMVKGRQLPRPIKLIVGFFVMGKWFFREKPKRVITIGMPMTIGSFFVSFWQKINRSVILDTHISAHLDYKSKQKTSWTFKVMSIFTHNRWIYKKIFQTIDHVIGISPSVAKDAIESYHVDPDKVDIIPPIIKQDYFDCDLPQKRPSNKILYIGRLSEEKNIGDVLKAMQLVVRERDDVHLDIVGDGDCRDILEKQAQSLSLENHVTFHGASYDLSKFHNTTTMQILTSHYEGFPLVLVEAMACGVPCITYDGAFAPSDIIDDGENGFVVPQYDVKALKNAIIKSCDMDWDPQKIRDQSMAFHPDKVSEKIIYQNQ